MTIYNTKNLLNQVLPAAGRIMALDVGQKRIGIAITDESRFLSSPKDILTRRSNERDFEKIADFIKTHKILAIIIGLPLNMDDSESEMSKFVRKFSENLDNFLKKEIPMMFYDERLTSFEARQISKSSISRKKKHCDDIAASLILEGFLSL